MYEHMNDWEIWGEGDWRKKRAVCAGKADPQSCVVFQRHLEAVSVSILFARLSNIRMVFYAAFTVSH